MADDDWEMISDTEQEHISSPNQDSHAGTKAVGDAITTPDQQAPEASRGSYDVPSAPPPDYDHASLNASVTRSPSGGQGTVSDAFVNEDLDMQLAMQLELMGEETEDDMLARLMHEQHSMPLSTDPLDQALEGSVYHYINDNPSNAIEEASYMRPKRRNDRKMRNYIRGAENSVEEYTNMRHPTDLQRRREPRPVTQDPKKWPTGLPRFSDLKARSRPFESPIADLENGSPLLLIAKPDILLCITDFLCFPDTFALGLSCRAISAVINLGSKKQQYLESLKAAGASALSKGTTTGTHGIISTAVDACDPTATSSTLLCDICIYALPPSYFANGIGSRDKTERICRDCLEFRKNMASQDLPGSRKAYVPWRPSKRITVPGTGGRLWYRKRT